jgi:RNA polymerase sigma factor (sigma-70 family)
MTPSFHDAFVALFDEHYERLFRYLDRLGGDPALAADLAQDAFLRLYRRGAPPDRPAAWLVTVALNLFRNARATARRRARLLTTARGEQALADPPASPARGAEAADERRRVRAALDALDERDRALLLLLAEGYRYRDMAAALDLQEASVGTLLARAKRAFRERYGEHDDASR